MQPGILPLEIRQAYRAERCKGIPVREHSGSRCRATLAATHESGCRPTLRRRQAKLARSVGESPTQVMLSRQPGSECCVSRRRRRPRSVHSGCVGCVIEPRNGCVAGAETVRRVERNMDRAAKRGHARLPGSKSRSRAKGSRRNLGDPAFGQGNRASGPHREGKTDSR
jgi:hypothetical protein